MAIVRKLLGIIILSFVVVFSSGAVQAKKEFTADSVTVQKGDTLYGISNKYNTSVEAIMELNMLKDTLIYPGQILILTKEEPYFYKVMAGSFLHYDNANNRVLLLEDHDMTAIIKKNVIDGKVYYRVQAGAFLDKENADRQLQAVKDIGIADAYIQTKN